MVNGLAKLHGLYDNIVVLLCRVFRISLDYRGGGLGKEVYPDGVGLWAMKPPPPGTMIAFFIVTVNRPAVGVVRGFNPTTPRPTSSLLVFNSSNFFSPIFLPATIPISTTVISDRGVNGIDVHAIRGFRLSVYAMHRLKKYSCSALSGQGLSMALEYRHFTLCFYVFSVQISYCSCWSMGYLGNDFSLKRKKNCFLSL